MKSNLHTMKLEMRKHSFFIGACVALMGTACYSCTGREQVQSDGWTLNLEKAYPHKSLVLQDVADVKYVRLETDSTFLVAGNKVSCLTDETIGFIDNKSGQMLFFSRADGKKAFSFNRKGRGPEEYLYVGDLAYDDARDEAYLWCIMEGAFKVYDSSGKYKRTLPLRNARKGDFPIVTQVLDAGDYLLCSQNRPKGYALHYLLDKQTPSKSVLLDSVPASRVVNIYLQQQTAAGIRSAAPEVASVSLSGGKMIVADYSSDTLFCIRKEGILEKGDFVGKEDAKVPYIVRTPSVHASTNQALVSYQGESQDWIFLIRTELSYDFNKQEGFPQRCYGLQKSTGEIFEVDFKDADFQKAPGALHRSASYLQVFDLKEAASAGEILNPDVRRWVEGLTEDDNGLVRIVDYR